MGGKKRKHRERKHSKPGSKLCQFAFFVFERHFITYLNMLGFCFQLSALLSWGTSYISYKAAPSVPLHNLCLFVHSNLFLSIKSVFHFCHHSIDIHASVRFDLPCVKNGHLYGNGHGSRSDTFMHWNVLQHLWTSALVLMFHPSPISVAKKHHLFLLVNFYAPCL